MIGGHQAGELFGDKELARYAGRNPHGHHLWEWRCRSCHLVRGPSTIAHLRRATRCQDCALRGERNPRWRGYKDLSGRWLSSCQRDAHQRGLRWDVDAAALWRLWQKQQGRCALTGWRLAHGRDASLDRIDSSQGYERGNLQWVHRDVNQIKSALPQDRFVEICVAVAAHTGEGLTPGALQARRIHPSR